MSSEVDSQEQRETNEIYTEEELKSRAESDEEEDYENNEVGHNHYYDAEYIASADIVDLENE